jgi:superfamily II DNA or RNA helicase
VPISSSALSISRSLSETDDPRIDPDALARTQGARSGPMDSGPQCPTPPNAAGAGAWRTDPTQPVQIISAQTLSRRSRPDVDIVIVDEAHELQKSVLSWIADPACFHVTFIGLSATPWSRGLGKYYEVPIVSSTTAELIQAGYLLLGALSR